MNYDKAEYYCNFMEEIANSFSDDETAFHDRLYFLRAKILEVRGRYAEALELAEKAYFLMLDTENDPLNMNEILFLKARLLIRLGKGEEGIALFDSIQTRTDRIRDTEFNAQLDEIRTHYEVDKINAEKERIRNYLLFALAGCLLLAILLGVYIYYSRLVTNKNRGLYRQIKEQDSLAKELERMKHLYETEAAVIPEAESVAAPAGNRQQQQLVAQFHKYIQGEPNDIRPDKIDLDKMVADLATNRTYLFEAVKAVTDKTPVDYIYSMRLEEAKQLLEARLDLNVEVIAEECGFNSRSTFYRLFRERYQISPTMYRKMAREKV